jgi:hypothetical protein
MLHFRKDHSVPVFILVMLISGCVIAWNGLARHRVSTPHASTQPESTVQNATLPAADVRQAQDAGDRSRVESGYAQLPLSFEPNLGQINPQVRFVSRARNRTLWLTKDEAVLTVARRSHPRATQPSIASNNRIQQAVLRMRFVGSNTDARVVGQSRQEGTVNYFVGRPEQWKTGIPVYSRVRYSSLYPGIDLVFYGNNRQLEYDLVVSPGADPGKIKFAITGAKSMRIDEDGNLVLKTVAGDVIQQKPRTYQRNGSELVTIAGDYVIHGNEVGLRLGSYDVKSAVVIDPVLRYASYLTGGGDESEEGTAIAIDSSNRAIVAGWTCSTVFPGEEGNPNSSCPAAFVTKFDFAGSRMIFTAFVAGVVFSDNVPLALDSANNIYIAGSTNGNTFGQDTFVPTAGAFQETFGGQTDAWVAKLNSSGTELIYATFLGGSGNEQTGGLAVDSAGNAYVTGSTTSKNFPIVDGSFQRECWVKTDTTCASAFVTKLDPMGSRALYSSYLGGHGTQAGEGIAVNSSGSAFVVGKTDANDFPTTAGTEKPVPAGGGDAFIAKLSSSGSHLEYSTFLGGTGLDEGNAIALDSSGNAYVTGETKSADFPVKNAFQRSCSGACTFVSKLNTSGRLVYSTFLGSGGGRGTGIAVTAGAEAYVTGEPGAKFPITQNAFQRVQGPQGLGNQPGGSIFLTKFGSAGQLIYSSYLGGGLNSPRVALDRSTNAYLTGVVGYAGTVPATPGAFQETRGAELDAFVAKVVPLCALGTVDRTVTICGPTDGGSVKSPVNIIAGTTDITPVRLTQVYVDGTKIYEAPLSAINVRLPIAAGRRRLTVQVRDTNGALFKKTVYITVSP